MALQSEPSTKHAKSDRTVEKDFPFTILYLLSYIYMKVVCTLLNGCDILVQRLECSRKNRRKVNGAALLSGGGR